MMLKEKAPRWRPRGGGLREGPGTLSYAHYTTAQPYGQAFWESVAESLMPDGRTYEGELRQAHRDLAELPTECLAREAAQIAQVLPWLRPRHPDAPWLSERLARLQAELARRGSDGR